MDKRTNKTRGSALLVVLLILTGIFGIGGVYEFHKANEKNTPKAIQTTVLKIDAAKQMSDALSEEHAKDDKARTELENAHKATLSNIAGNATGAKTALTNDPNPSVDVKIAELMVDNILDTTGAATPQQVARFVAIVKGLEEANAKLVAENGSLKNTNLTLTKDFNDVRVENAQTKANLTVAQSVATQTKSANDELVKKVVLANNIASSSSKQIEIVNQTWEERLKAWFLGLGFFGIGGALVLFAVLPVLGTAFPVLLPLIKSLTGFVLGLWHNLYNKAVAEVESLHSETKATLAETEAELAAEQAAHASTKSALVTTQAQVVSIATTPTVADNLVASMAAPTTKPTT